MTCLATDSSQRLGLCLLRHNNGSRSMTLLLRRPQSLLLDPCCVVQQSVFGTWTLAAHACSFSQNMPVVVVGEHVFFIHSFFFFCMPRAMSCNDY